MGWLLGKCIYENKCYYAHDRTYLPHGGWWNDRRKVRALGDELRMSLDVSNKRLKTGIFFATLSLLNNWRHDEWASGKFSALDDEPVPLGRLGDMNSITVNTTQRDGQLQHDYLMNTGAARARAGRRYGDEWEDDEEDEQKANNLGFDEEELNELFSQGVKPWDDDAWVRNAF